MESQKINHMQGGKVLAVTLIVSAISLVVVSVFLIIDKYLDFISIITLLFCNVTVMWLAYKFYKPGFTEVICSENGIVSKTNFEQEKLSLEDIKGIWYYKNNQSEQVEIKPYSKNNESLKGTVIIIGDIDFFKDVEFSGINGATILRDSFKKGYTTLHYRKSLDKVLNYYMQKIESRS